MSSTLNIFGWKITHEFSIFGLQEFQTALLNSSFTPLAPYVFSFAYGWRRGEGGGEKSPVEEEG